MEDDPADLWRRRRLVQGLSDQPGDAEQMSKALEKYAIYQSLVVSRLTDPSKSKAELLEQEGRGWSLFWQKWQALMRKWDGRVAEKARQPKLNALGFEAWP